MATNVTNVTKHFPKPQPGFTTTTSGPVSSGATSVPLNSTGNYSNGDVVALIIDPTDSDKKQVFVGTIDTSGSQVTGVVWTDGTNQSHASGATVVDYWTATHVQMMTKGILVEHDQDGKHADTVTLHTVVEKNAGSGVTIDGLNIKDGKLNTANSVEGQHLATNAITLGYSERTSDFSTTTSGSYVDVTDLSVAVTVPSGGRRLKITAYCRNVDINAAGQGAYLAIREGSTTLTENAATVAGTSYAVSLQAIYSAIVSQGSHTYKVSIKQDLANTITLRASSTAPAFILVELI